MPNVVNLAQETKLSESGSYLKRKIYKTLANVQKVCAKAVLVTLAILITITNHSSVQRVK